MIKFLQQGGKVQKYILGGMLLIICVAMVWSLTPTFNDSGTIDKRGVVARVGDEEISSSDISEMAHRLGQQQFGGNVPDQFLPMLMPGAAQQLINEKAVLLEARHMGLRVTDEELQDFLKRRFGAELFPGGKFIGQEQYEELLQRNGTSSAKFEAAMRSQLLTVKLLDVVTSGVAIGDSEIEQAFQRDSTKVKLQYAALSVTELQKQVKFTEGELRAFYDKNKARYKDAIPEKRRAAYVLIDTNQIQQQVKAQISPQDIQNYYNQHREMFRVPEQIKVRHILVATPTPGPDDKVDPKAVDAARVKAEDILKKLKAGGDFTALANQYSEDPGNVDEKTKKKKGGDLGWINRQTAFVQEFKDAAFKLGAGQISDPVKSDFGFHIIQVEEKQDAHIKPLEEVKDQIAQQLSAQKVAATLEQTLNKLETEAKTASIDKAASDAHLQAYHSEWFGQADSLPGIGSSPQFTEAAFSAKQGGPPVTVDLPQGKAVLVVTQIQPARTPSFEEWRSKVEADYKQRRGGELLAQKTQELADRAHALHDLKAAAKEVGATVKTSDLLTRGSNVPELGAMSGPPSTAFEMQPGQISSPVEHGDYGAVFEVLEKQAPAAAELATKKEAIRQQLLDRKRQVRWQLFSMDLRARLQAEHKIVINQDEWKRLTGNNNPLEVKMEMPQEAPFRSHGEGPYFFSV